MAREKTPPDANDKTQRRVYVLPTELVERIGAFQSELGLASEVEAARRLLDEALKRRDTFDTITGRLIAQIKKVRSLRDAAKEILVDHPLVTQLSFDLFALRFTLSNSIRVEADLSCKATVWDGEDNYYDFGSDVPEWASEAHPKRLARSKGQPNRGSLSETLDDDIPF